MQSPRACRLAPPSRTPATAAHSPQPAARGAARSAAQLPAAHRQAAALHDRAPGSQHCAAPRRSRTKSTASACLPGLPARVKVPKQKSRVWPSTAGPPPPQSPRASRGRPTGPLGRATDTRAVGKPHVRSLNACGRSCIASATVSGGQLELGRERRSSDLHGCPRGRVASRHPSVPSRVHFWEVSHVAQEDLRYHGRPAKPSGQTRPPGWPAAPTDTPTHFLPSGRPCQQSACLHAAYLCRQNTGLVAAAACKHGVNLVQDGLGLRPGAHSDVLGDLRHRRMQATGHRAACGLSRARMLCCAR